jgi:hypothetical protein
MSWSRSKVEEFFAWGEHVRLVFDVVTFIASWKTVKKLLSYIPQISHDWASIISWIVASLILLGLVIWNQKRSQQKTALPQLSQPAQDTGTALIPATSSIVPEIGPNFDAKQFFRNAYYSTVTAEVEKNIRAAAGQNQPDDREGFLARFIGVGVVVYLHDSTWYTIYKSQFIMLSEMNSKNGWMPLADAKNFYDKASAEYHPTYSNYSFEQWLGYMKRQQLILQHPSDMLEITVRGKDFLKYLTHWGRSINGHKG